MSPLRTRVSACDYMTTADYGGRNTPKSSFENVVKWSTYSHGCPKQCFFQHFPLYVRQFFFMFFISVLTLSLSLFFLYTFFAVSTFIVEHWQWHFVYTNSDKTIKAEERTVMYQISECMNRSDDCPGSFAFDAYTLETCLVPLMPYPAVCWTTELR